MEVGGKSEEVLKKAGRVKTQNTLEGSNEILWNLAAARMTVYLQLNVSEGCARFQLNYTAQCH